MQNKKCVLTYIFFEINACEHCREFGVILGGDFFKLRWWRVLEIIRRHSNRYDVIFARVHAVIEGLVRDRGEIFVPEIRSIRKTLLKNIISK